MLRIVVYDDETMEPITAIHLERWMFERLRHGDHIRIPYQPHAVSYYAGPGGIDVPARCWAEVWFEEFVRHGHKHWFCFTRDGEHAVRLKPTFLAGQISEVQRREHEAFQKGVLTALREVFKTRRQHE